MSPEHVDVFTLAERLHRKFLDFIQMELDQQGVCDVNSVRALILLNLRDEELTVSELMRSGCYLGSNVSYNLKKLTDADYIEQVRSSHDKRVVLVRNSSKGRTLCEALMSATMRHLIVISPNPGEEDDLTVCRRALRGLERSCSRMIAGRGFVRPIQRAA